MLITAGTFRRFLVVIAAYVATCTSCHGGEPTEVATLRLHRVRAADAQTVAARVAEQVAAECVLLIPATGQLAVLAAPSTQIAVAEEIAAHEKDAILFARFDLRGRNLTDIETSLKVALRHASRETGWKPIRFRMEASSRTLNVWAQESQISFIEQFIRHPESKASRNQVAAKDPPQATKRTSPASPLESQLPPHGAESVRSGEGFPDGGQHGEPAIGLPLPRGPVRIVLIKELDLVLIRANGQSFGNEMRQLPVPSGDVKIRSGRAADR
jgi:hypothetical protein